MAESLTLERYDGSSITDEIVRDAANLFSNNYGIWGPPAEAKMGSFAKQGRRVRMSPKMLKSQCMAAEMSQNIYIRAMNKTELVGNVFITRWKYDAMNICWVTQLCVRQDFRHQGLATRLLSELRGNQNDGECVYGILSSHPFAIAATLRAFDEGIENFGLEMTRTYARVVMASSPAKYVREARVRGSIFEDKGDGEAGDGVVSCADTNFYVDHQEPLRALEVIRDKGVVWPYGHLPEGHEFLAIVGSVARSGM